VLLSGRFTARRKQIVAVLLTSAAITPSQISNPEQYQLFEVPHEKTLLFLDLLEVLPVLSGDWTAAG
jgi:hypothetical protein